MCVRMSSSTNFINYSYVAVTLHKVLKLSCSRVPVLYLKYAMSESSSFLICHWQSFYFILFVECDITLVTDRTLFCKSAGLN